MNRYRSLHFLSCLLLGWMIVGPGTLAGAAPPPPRRIVSLAPALTEIIFALGAGDQLVGVTRYCDFPARVRAIPKVGGVMDLNVEQLYLIKPDLIVGYSEMRPLLNVYGKARLELVPHTSLRDLLDSIRTIGRALAREGEASALLKTIQTALDEAQAMRRNQPRRRVLLVVGRSPDFLQQFIAVGKGDFLIDILHHVNAENAYSGNIAYPQISIESVIAMRPEVILELSSHYEKISRDILLAHWQRYPFIPAVAHKRIHFATDNLWLRPGPRISELVRRIAAML